MKYLIKKKIGIMVLVGIFIFSGIFVYQNKTTEQISINTILEKTYNISKQYVLLRYQTDTILRNAKNYKDYNLWNTELNTIILSWGKLDKDALFLEQLAKEISEEKISFDFIQKSNAYNKQEISDIFDKAPAGKKIATLAKYLGVDAKKAFKILKQDQAQVEADTWNEAGDTFQKLETSATLIKDGCKVTGFVGGIIVTGGTAGFVGSSTIGQAAVIVSGADLTLEISDDTAKIALGNHNKISAIVSEGRKITEPLATLLNISIIPSNLEKGIDKFNAVMTGLDQFNSAVQDGKIVGIELPAYKKDGKNIPIETVVLEKNEVEKWLKEIGKDKNNDTITKEEIEEILGKIDEEIKFKTKVEENKLNTNNTKNSGDSEAIIGVWEGIIKSTPSQNAKEEQTKLSLSLNKDGSVETTSEVDGFDNWKQEGNIVTFYANDLGNNGEDISFAGNYVFDLKGDTMTFVKLEGPDEADPTKIVEVLAGSDFFGGKFYTITLKKQ